MVKKEIEKQKDPEQVKKGKRNKQKGKDFELKVRKDLEKKSFIVCKWSNNVEWKWDPMGASEILAEQGKLIAAKHKWNFFKRAMAMGTGFPDFVAFQKIDWLGKRLYDIIGIEAKSNGTLSKDERNKCRWLLQSGIFNRILIASGKNIKETKEIEYIDFTDRYPNHQQKLSGDT